MDYDVIRALGEVSIIMFGFWVAFRNKSKAGLISELEEKVKRQRIEIVVKETKLDELEEEVEYSKEELVDVREEMQRNKARLEKKAQRTRDRNHKITQIHPDLTDAEISKFV